MTPQQARALRTLERLGERLTPALRDAYEKALRRLALAGDVDRAAEALSSGDLAAALDALLPPQATAQAEHELTTAIARVMHDAGPSQAREIASILRLTFTYLPGAPASADALASLVRTLVHPAILAMRDAIGGALRAGLIAGRNPVVVARTIRSMIGLTPADTAMVRSFVEQLRSDPARALTRALRDGRYDRTVAASIDGRALADAQLATMEEAYARRLVAFRAETWSRTATLQAIRQTQHANWLDAADALGVPRDRLIKTWITTLDGRERPTHHALHGDTVPIDAPFANGDMVPGDGTGIEGIEYNCRCVQAVRVLPANAKAAQQFLSDRAAQFATQRAQRAA